MGKRNHPFQATCHATVVVDRRTKRLCQRLAPQQIAVLDHIDLDEVAAESLIDGRVLAVINTSPFLTGTYPAEGAKRLLQAGIPIYEAGRVACTQENATLCDMLHDGDDVMIHKGALYINCNERWTYASPLYEVTHEQVEQKRLEAHQRLNQTLAAFIDNTLDYMKLEKELVYRRLGHIPLQRKMANRHVIVVVRGKHYKEDLRMLSSYIREYCPFLLAVDGGADALLDNGYTPDLIIGDMDSVSDRALQSGAEVVVHAFPDGQAPGKVRVEALGIPYTLLPFPGTSEDVALLLAYEEAAELIVTIGTHSNMIDFLEKGRKGMASTLLVRTKIGSKLIDAKGVSLLYQPRLNWQTCLWFGLAAAVPIIALFAISPATRYAAQLVWSQWTMSAP